MNIGFTYDLKSEYLQQGLSLEEAAEFDQEDTIEGIAQTLQSLGHRIDRIGNLKSSDWAFICGRSMGFGV